MKNFRKSISCILVAMFIACTAVAVLADDDPPSRAARINRIIGQVSIQPAGVEDWALAANNRPLTTGDNVWGDQGASAELHIGSAAMRIGSETSLTLTNLSDNMVQLGLNQGTLNLRIKHIFDGETYEVDTPNLAFTVFEKGNYRFDVDPNGDTTVVTVWNGNGEATGDGPAVGLGSRQQARFTGGRSLQNEITSAPGFDSFDEMVEDDASWAYRFQREYKQKTKDLDDIYFDIKDSEERRKKKGLPPRLVILPGWDVSDEERYDEEQAKKKKRAVRKKAGATKQRKSSPGGNKKRTQAVVAPASEGEASR